MSGQPRLERVPEGLTLVLPGEKFKPLHIDFVKTWRQLRIGKQDVFAKAIGVRSGWTHVIDATAGLGQDTIKLLKLGCTVTAIEQSPLLFELLKDAAERAMANDLWRQGAATRFTLTLGNSEDLLGTLAKQKTVIYLDPMFPERDSTALPKGEMQILNRILGASQPVQTLWERARTNPEARIVLKRPLKAPQELPPPSQSFLGKTVRYDVWYPV